MKKILAVAVATAISAPAMADMTITGSVAAGYSYGETAPATYGSVSDTAVLTSAADATEDTAGFGIDTASIAISASETTESGLTVAGSITAGGLTRGSDVSGENASLSLSGDFGKVSLSAVESGSGIVGLGLAGAPVEAPEDEVFSAKANVDLLTYTLPAMGPVTLSVTQGESANEAVMGVGAGEDGSFQLVKAALASGAFKAAADYTNFADNNTRIRVSGNVDLGAVVLGAGYETREIAAVSAAAAQTANLAADAYYDDGGDATAPEAVAAGYTLAEAADAYDRKDMVVGIKVPMGATTLGASWAKREVAASSVNGWSVGVSHKLSENVAVTVKHAQWDGDNQKGSALVSLSF